MIYLLIIYQYVDLKTRTEQICNLTVSSVINYLDPVVCLRNYFIRSRSVASH
jgi:hypothetical protein